LRQAKPTSFERGDVDARDEGRESARLTRAHACDCF
jgi:hypothetical protein